MQKNEIVLSIVIIVRNEQERIEKCLNSILEQIDQQRMEVLLIDGNSTDNTLKIIKKFEKETQIVTVIKCNGYGYAYQRNVGKNNAKGEYVLYISGDTIVSKGMLKKYMNVIQSDAYDVIQGSILNVDNDSRYGSYMKNVYPIFYKSSIGNIGQEISTVNICIRRKLLEKYSFDESINSMEDKEWFVRVFIKEKSIDFRRLHSACVYHIVHEDFWRYNKKIFHEAKALDEINKNYREKYNTNFFNWITYVDNVLWIGLLISLIIMILLVNQQGKIMILLLMLTFLLKQIYIILYYFRDKNYKFIYALLINIYLDTVFVGHICSKMGRVLKGKH